MLRATLVVLRIHLGLQICFVLHEDLRPGTQVMSWLFAIPLRTVNNTKTQENISVCTA